jgi:hypothetical protein
LCDFGLARSIAPKLVKEELKQEINEDNLQVSKENQDELDVTPNTVSSTTKDVDDKG